MRTLASLPMEHKLHKAFEEHVEEVTAMQLEVEKLQRLADLEIAKARILRCDAGRVRGEHAWLS
jgi:regulator of replication initiation timing